MEKAIKIIKKLGFDIIDRQDDYVGLWEAFYKGNVPDFHIYKDYQGAELGSVTRTRKSLKMAKIISEIWADNLINPETIITIDDKYGQGWLETYIKANGVKRRMNKFIEKAFALSNGATVQYMDEYGRAVNQYLTMNAVYPLKQKNGEVTSCAFVSIEPNENIYIQFHVKEDDGYRIKNMLFDKTGKPLELPNNVEEEFFSEVKLFQLYNPAIANNVNLDSPLGISIFANAIDELKAVDIAFDALDKEVRNGRMRVFVQGEALHIAQGETAPLFNKDQDEFFLLPEDAKNPDGTLIKVQAPTLRVTDLINNLEKQLNLLGSKCGLGDNAFHAEGGTIYTNTDQVVSSNSKFYKTRQKHATEIETSLIEMVEAWYYLEHGTPLMKDVSVEFDDSIIHDKNESWNRSLQLFNLGLISRVQLFMDIYGMTEKEAIAYNNLQVDKMGLEIEETLTEEGGEF